MKTLISFIGTGRRQEGSQTTYQKTCYEFPDGTQHETAILAEAFVRRSELEISACILLGTHGSSWGCLIEEAALQDDQIWEIFT
jgi:hypothetical protein